MVKIGVLRLIKIILRWSTFDIETRILHNSHRINRIWIGIQLDLIVFKSYFKYSWGGYECIIGFRGNCHVSYSRYMFWCTTRVTLSEKVKHWDFSLVKTHESKASTWSKKVVSTSPRNIKKGVGALFVATWNIFCAIYTLCTTHRSRWLKKRSNDGLKVNSKIVH